MNDFSSLDDKSVETICRVLRRTRGLIIGDASNNGFSLSAMSDTNT